MAYILTVDTYALTLVTVSGGWDGLEKLGRGSEAGRELRELVSLRDKQPLSCCLLRATVVILDSLNTGVSQPGYYNFVFFLRDDVSRAETFCFLVFFVTVAFVPRSTWLLLILSMDLAVGCVLSCFVRFVSPWLRGQD